MKKKDLKKLKLSKTTISKFNSNKIHGGQDKAISILFGCDSISTCPYSLGCTAVLCPSEGICKPDDKIIAQ